MTTSSEKAAVRAFNHSPNGNRGRPQQVGRELAKARLLASLTHRRPPSWRRRRGNVIDEHFAVDLSGIGPALTDNPNASKGRPRAPTALPLLEKEPWLSRDLWRRSGPCLPRGSPLEQR